MNSIDARLARLQDAVRKENSVDRSPEREQARLVQKVARTLGISNAQARDQLGIQ